MTIEERPLHDPVTIHEEAGDSGGDSPTLNADEIVDDEITKASFSTSEPSTTEQATSVTAVAIPHTPVGTTEVTEVQAEESSAGGVARGVVIVIAVLITVVVVALKVTKGVSRAVEGSTATSSGQDITVINDCPTEYAAFNNCVDPVLGGAICESCITGYLPSDGTSNCLDFDDETCNGLANCPCNGCDAKYIAYVDCTTNWICSFDCTSNSSAFPGSNVDFPTTVATESPGFSGGAIDAFDDFFYPSPVPSVPSSAGPCDQLYAAYEWCLSLPSQTSWMCTICVQQNYAATKEDTCEDLVAGACLVMELCKCHFCDSEFLEYAFCVHPGLKCYPSQCSSHAPEISPTPSPAFTLDGDDSL